MSLPSLLQVNCLGEEEVDADEVMLNTVLSVKAGEAIPIDGENCEVDEKTLTGESFPVANKTTALAEDCVVAKMEKLVEEARNSKSKTQRFIDKFAQYYTPGLKIWFMERVVMVRVGGGGILEGGVGLESKEDAGIVQLPEEGVTIAVVSSGSCDAVGAVKTIGDGTTIWGTSKCSGVS
ncbi:hypothetical protein POTOM_003525 [Populus tomentosa]|uniref:P-type ATPase A domain-containing protein n=1 Tax=Populus tomentosa TaxID=118781 RepID=A0A8X8J086_POPTO|nr:hypothetical protein POTOM_003525 [Populus tomentosa]